MRAKKITFFILTATVVSLAFRNFYYSAGGHKLVSIDRVLLFTLMLFSVSIFCIVKNSITINKLIKGFTVLLIVPILTIGRTIENSSLIEWVTLYTQISFDFVLVTIMYNINLSNKNLAKVLRIWFYTALGLSIYGIINYFVTSVGGSNLLSGRAAYANRLHATFAEPSFFAAYAYPIFLAACWDIYQGRPKLIVFKSETFSALCILIIAFAFVLNASLSGLGILVLTPLIILYLLLPAKKYAIYGVIYTSVSVVFVVLLFIWVPALKTRIKVFEILLTGISSGPTNSSLGVRLASHLTAFNAWIAHPILGVGLNNFSAVATNHTPEWVYGIKIESAHNAFLQVLSEIGIVGFISYTYVCIKIVYMHLNNYFNCLRKIDKSVAFLSLIISVSVIVNLVSGFPYMSPMVWFLLSLGLSSEKCGNAVVRNQQYV